MTFWRNIKNHFTYRFVEAEYEYGFERFMQKGLNKANGNSIFRKFNPIIESTINSITNKTTGLIPALEMLQIGYNEMKEHLDPTSSTLPATTIATDVLKGLEKLEKLFDGETNIDVLEDDESSHINTKRRKIRKKAFDGVEIEPEPVPGSSSSSTKKKISMKYRTSITDDGDFLKIAKASIVKSGKPNRFNERQIKSVIKQLGLPK